MRQFRSAGQPAPAKPPTFPRKPGPNSPPYRLTNRSSAVRAAIAAAATREG
jgi:hypothetical protein